MFILVPFKMAAPSSGKLRLDLAFAGYQQCQRYDRVDVIGLDENNNRHKATVLHGAAINAG
ncbi:hypothetical protein [Cypionkella sp.]|nr:hypothetical protein [Cypionkella sp.]MDZ4395557.1 hypothetical protein [Cypionkella sp.]